MIFPAPVADPGAPLARRNPVAKLGAATVLAAGLLATVDPVAPGVTLAVELGTLPLFGVPLRRLAARAWPLLLSAGAIALVQVLFAQRRQGAVLVPLGPWSVTSGVALSAGGLAFRVLAVALPGIVVFATTDPTDLADSLVQQLRVPPRFAIGALAAFRLLPLLGAEWRLLALARRARGIEAGRSPLARARLLAAMTYALLVGAIRRGVRLSVAMDARGFGLGLPRTSARPQRFAAADAALVAGAALVVALALGASLAAGTFRPLFS